MGFNAYRFSIEWARVEPADGFISRAALRRYADVLAACHELGITPVVTFHHFTSPRWLMKLGGWESPEIPGLFAAYSRAVMQELGSLIPYVCTINEANLPILLRLMGVAGAQAPVGMDGEGHESATAPEWLQAAAHDSGASADRFKPFLFAAPDATKIVILAAHERAREAIKAIRAETQVGITLALPDVQALPGGEARAEAIRDDLFRNYLPACDGDDFIGVQNYTRERVGPDGFLPVEAGVETTQMGYEYYPQALEGVLRLVAGAGLPMIVTENGLATEDDARRVAFIIFASLAEFERDLIRERTNAGLAAAQARGRKGGRPKGVDQRKKQVALALKKDAGRSVREICEIVGISRNTYYKYTRTEDTSLPPS